MAAEDERPAGAWHAEWQPLREALRLTGGAAGDAAELAAGLRVHPEAMRAHLDLTARPARLGAPGRRLRAPPRPARGPPPGHRRLPAAAEKGRPLGDALAEVPELAGLLDADTLRDLLDPARYLGAAAALTDRALRRRPPGAAR